jgi:thioredoxin 1
VSKISAPRRLFCRQSLASALGAGLSGGTLLLMPALSRAIPVIDGEKASVGDLLRKSERCLVWFHAEWCGTCLQQLKVIDGLRDQRIRTPIIKVDFDSGKSLRRELKVVTPSTFLVFVNGKEVQRSVGQVNPENLKKLLVG